MRKLAILFALCIGVVHSQEILRIPSFDGEMIEGRLNIPSTGFINTIVIDVPSSGPHTYVNMRKIGRSTIFKYHDYFQNEFARRGIAYFSYSTRYTAPDSTNPPNYDKVDKDKFFTYTPGVKVKDLEAVITSLRKDARLSRSRFVLLGFSEGTILASLVADRRQAPVDALFLAGTPADDVFTTMLWQLGGAASMVNYCRFFDENKDGVIQKAEYMNADPRARARMGDRKFEELDQNADSVLTADDFRALVQPWLRQILAAVEKDDNEWIWSSFFRVGVPWIKEHRALEPNKTRLLRLDLPVHIYHGVCDANCPVEGMIQLQKAAADAGKKNIHINIIPGADHTLEFLAWVVKKSPPDGLKMMFEDIEKL